MLNPFVCYTLNMDSVDMTTNVNTNMSTRSRAQIFQNVAKLFHRETYVAVTATYTGPYHETCYAYLNAANRLNLTHT